MSILRKITTICLRRRIWERLSPCIPKDQEAYQAGRSTTEQVHAIKLLAEKAVSSSDYTIFILLLDMSKAFDSVNRNILFSHLEEILNPDELHLLHILTNHPKIKVQVGKTLGEKFITLLGIMQGDVLSAILFIFYLACCLRTREIKTIGFVTTPKYADDITFASSEKQTIDTIKTEVPAILKPYNLIINNTKTEEYTIPQPPPTRKRPDMDTLLKHKHDKPLWSELDWLINVKDILEEKPNWRKCKLLGSLLGTRNDIKRRKALALDALRKLNYIFNSKRISLDLKLRTFSVYVISIFMYNSELWTLTRSLENEIDAFHRRMLRYAVGVKWPNKISSENLYKITKAEKWSKTIKGRRLRWLGHLMRLPAEAPVKLCLVESLKHAKKPRGHPVTTWLQVVKKDLVDLGVVLDLSKGEEVLQKLDDLTSDRVDYRRKVRTLMQ